jgi:hypothetical protein
MLFAAAEHYVLVNVNLKLLIVLKCLTLERQCGIDDSLAESAPSTAAPKPVKKSNTPDISDIINKTEHNERKKKAADMSVDDLLKLIEEEKKKL